MTPLKPPGGPFADAAGVSPLTVVEGPPQGRGARPPYPKVGRPPQKHTGLTDGPLGGLPDEGPRKGDSPDGGTLDWGPLDRKAHEMGPPEWGVPPTRYLDGETPGWGAPPMGPRVTSAVKGWRAHAPAAVPHGNNGKNNSSLSLQPHPLLFGASGRGRRPSKLLVWRLLLEAAEPAGPLPEAAVTAPLHSIHNTFLLLFPQGGPHGEAPPCDVLDTAGASGGKSTFHRNRFGVVGGPQAAPEGSQAPPIPQ